MGNINLIEKTQKNIKILTWVLIIGSGMILLSALFILGGYSNMIYLQSRTKSFNPPVQINFSLYFVLNAIKLLLSIVIFLFAIFVLKYKDNWRKVLVYTLTTAVLYLLVSPIVNYLYFPMQDLVSPKGMEKEMLNMAKSSMLIFSYIWSFVFIAFFIYVIKRMTNMEVVKLFS